MDDKNAELQIWETLFLVVKDALFFFTPFFSYVRLQLLYSHMCFLEAALLIISCIVIIWKIISVHCNVIIVVNLNVIMNN